jgi:hypothetical protein
MGTVLSRETRHSAVPTPLKALVEGLRQPTFLRKMDLNRAGNLGEQLV